jgi:hypothetical protein
MEYEIAADVSGYAYTPVNPSGAGEAEWDWAGISIPSSTQRAWFRTTLDNAASRGHHVVVVGHRPVYGPTDISLRANFTEALDTTDVGGYPLGFMAELENWCATNNKHAVFVSGDHHAFAITRPIYRGAVNNDYGVIHINLTSGMGFRNNNVATASPSLFFAYAGSGGDNLPTDLVVQRGQGYKFFMIADWRSNKLVLELYHTAYAVYRVLPRYTNSGILIDRYEVPIQRGALTGPLRRVYSGNHFIL